MVRSRTAYPAVPLANRIVKRALDLGLGLPTAALAVPLLGALAGAYWLVNRLYPHDRGPLLRRVYRVAGNRPVTIHKFRISTTAMLERLAAELTDERVADLTAHLSPDDRARLEADRAHLVEDLAQQPTRFGSLLKQIYLDGSPRSSTSSRADSRWSVLAPFPWPTVGCAPTLLDGYAWPARPSTTAFAHASARA